MTFDRAALDAYGEVSAWIGEHPVFGGPALVVDVTRWRGEDPTDAQTRQLIVAKMVWHYPPVQAAGFRARRITPAEFTWGAIASTIAEGVPPAYAKLLEACGLRPTKESGDAEATTVRGGPRR